MELASGAGDSAVVRQLREAQLSKHLMLLHAVAEAADGADPSSPATAAFRAGYRLLAQVQAADPGRRGLAARPAAHRKLGARLPRSAWTRDRRPISAIWPLPPRRQRSGSASGSNWMSRSATAACCFPAWAACTYTGQGDVDAADAATASACASASTSTWRAPPSCQTTARAARRAALAGNSAGPGGGRRADLGGAAGDRRPVPGPVHTAHAHRHDGGRGHELAAADPGLPGRCWSATTAGRPGRSRSVSPSSSRSCPRSDLDSATSPAAFGAIATSWPPSPVSMAETLVHEFQHLKLCGLMDMLPLIEPCDERGYAPWREDPRPVGGLLQGVYAFTGIVRFWARPAARGNRARRRPPRRRAVRTLAARRSSVSLATLLGTASSRRPAPGFVTHAQGAGTGAWSSEPVPAEAKEIAREVALDNWLTWQFRHTAVDAAGVPSLAAAYQRGEPLGGQVLPETWIEDDIRKIDSIVRSRLLNMRYQEPRRYRQLCAADMPELGAADGLLVRGNASAAVAAYRAADRRRAGPSCLDRPGAGDPPAARRCHRGRYSPPTCRSCSRSTRALPARGSALIRWTWRPGSHDHDAR